ncbi:MAG: hypothetical protein ACO1RT_16810 [Planctomycetaceae bacterium]
MPTREKPTQNNDGRRADAPSPLTELARVIAAAGQQGLTPVIVCDRSITLADDFYVALCEAVRDRSGREVHLDLLPGHRLAGALRLLRHQQHVQRLRRRLADHGSVMTTAALSRTVPPVREIVIGFAGPKDELPSYAKPIELAA